jgi:hypothetical protein
MARKLKVIGTESLAPRHPAPKWSSQAKGPQWFHIEELGMTELKIKLEFNEIMEPEHLSKRD